MALNKNYTSLNVKEVTSTVLHHGYVTRSMCFAITLTHSLLSLSLPQANMSLPLPVSESPLPRHQRKISSTTEFKELTKKDAIVLLSSELDKLSLTAGNANNKTTFDSEIQGFKELYHKFIVGSGPVVWDKIEPLSDGAVRNYDSLHEPSPQSVREMLNKLVVVKLNGGLGWCPIGTRFNPCHSNPSAG